MCDECRCGPRDHHHHRDHDHENGDHRHGHPHDHPGWDPAFDRGPDRGPPRDRECDCGCNDDESGDFAFDRRFVSKAEVLEALEWYLQELQNEARGVKEAIADLRAEIAAAEAKEPAPAQAAAKPARQGRKATAKKAPPAP